MTLFVLDLKLPVAAGTTDAEAWRQVVEWRGHPSIYVLCFIVPGTYWIGHHHQFHSTCVEGLWRNGILGLGAAIDGPAGARD
ncbi:MAG TPA: TMEM175 family protein [Chthoniobacterales bacterium]